MNAKLRERMARCGADDSADTDDFRRAPAYLEVVDGFFQWRIPECPFCGLRHSHGGGRAGEDDPRDFLGHKLTHCLWVLNVWRGYQLIDVYPSRTAAMIRSERLTGL